MAPFFLFVGVSAWVMQIGQEKSADAVKKTDKILTEAVGEKYTSAKAKTKYTVSAIYRVMVVTTILVLGFIFLLGLSMWGWRFADIGPQ